MCTLNSPNTEVEGLEQISFCEENDNNSLITVLIYYILFRFNAVGTGQCDELFIHYYTLCTANKWYYYVES